MVSRLPLALLCLSFLELGAAAQVAAVAGPPVAPIGCPITIAVSNDTNASVQVFSSCPFSVQDSSGAMVYAAPTCQNMTFSPLAPGATFVSTWTQVDRNGVQVPPGNYTISVPLPPFPGGGVSMFPIAIGGTQAAIALRGVPRIGTARGLELCAPQDAGRSFGLAAALATSPGIPTCAGVIPLMPDQLFALSLSPGAFQGFQGVLGNTGQSSSPILAIPRSPALIGGTIFFDFVVLDASLSCPIARISAPLSVIIR